MTSHEPIEQEPAATAASADKSPALPAAAPAVPTVAADQYPGAAVKVEEKPARHRTPDEPKRSFARTFREELWADNSFTVTLLAIVLALICGAAVRELTRAFDMAGGSLKNGASHFP